MALVGYGAMVSACLTAADMLSQQGVSATVVDARFCKPLDAELLRQARPVPASLTRFMLGTPAGIAVVDISIALPVQCSHMPQLAGHASIVMLPTGTFVCLLNNHVRVVCTSMRSLHRGARSIAVSRRTQRPRAQHALSIAQVAAEHPVMISVEEGAIGGFGEHVSRFLLSEGLLGGGKRLKFSPMGLPDRYGAQRAVLYCPSILYMMPAAHVTWLTVDKSRVFQMPLCRRDR